MNILTVEKKAPNRGVKDYISKHGNILSWSIFSCAFLLLCLTQAITLPDVLNSDLSSEMVLGKYLSEHGGIFTPEWHYATELKLFGTHIIYALLFSICENWQVVHIAGSIISYVLYLAALYFLCYSLKIKRWFPVIGFVFIIPFSINYLYIVLQGTYYIFYLIQIFLVLGFLALFITNAREGKRARAKSTIEAICAMVVSFSAGLGGLRLFVVLAVPLFIASILLWIRDTSSRDRKRALLCSFLIMAGFVLGYLFNKLVLSSQITFHQQDYMNWTPLDLDGLSEYLTGVLSNYGYDHEAKVFSLSTLSCLCSFIIIAITAYSIARLVKAKDNNYISKLLGLYAACAFGAFAFIYCFTNMQYGQNHSTPALIMCLFAAVYAMIVAIDRKHTKLLAVVLAVCLIITSANYYKYWYEYEYPGVQDLYEVKDYLKNHGYTYGYSSYWQANVLTEMSDGAIEMYCWGAPSKKELKSLNERYAWNQLKSHENVSPAGDESFMVFTREEWESLKLSDEIKKRLNLLFENGDYLVFGFDKDR